MSTGRPPLTVTVAIVTYRRHEILRATLHSLRHLRRSPDQLLVVDASPDAAEQRAEILREFADLFATSGSDYLIATVPSITRQRNLAVDAATADIMVWLDDEARPEPDYLSKVLQVYEADVQGQIGGVGGTEVDEEAVSRRILNGIGDVARVLARRLSPPAHLFPRWRTPLPASVRALPLAPEHALHGAKMSFRTELLRTHRFDERMLRYSYCEDVDISYRVGMRYTLVRRRDAFVQHDEAWTARIDSLAMFLISWVNPAYLTEKLFPYEASRRPLWRFFRFARLRALLTPGCLRSPQRRMLVRQQFEVAERMMVFLRAGETTQLGERFSALQAYIFEDGQADLGSSVAFTGWAATYGNAMRGNPAV